VGACRALAELFSQVEPSVLQAHLGPVFVALGALLQESSDETLHLVLETLQAAVKAGLYYHCDYCKLVHMYVFFYMLTCAPCGVPYFQ
jgi:hypothetical protein